MTWTPGTVVNIGGVNYAGQTVEGVRVTMGRNEITATVRAGYASVELLDTTGAGIPVNILDSMYITIDDSLGNPVTVFTGNISDLDVELDANHINAVTRYTVTATGQLSRLARAVSEPTYPSQDEGTRIRAIFQSLVRSWDDMGEVTWNQIDPALTWNTFDYVIGDIDPGIYTLAAYSGDTTSAYSFAALAAISGQGAIYETADGLINYANAQHRTTEVQNNGFLQLDPDDVELSNIAVTSSAGDVVNETTVNYASGEATAKNSESMGLYGRRSNSVDTQLANMVDAQAWADRAVALYAYPRKNISSFTVPIHLDSISDTQRDALIGITFGQPVEIAGLPAPLIGGPFQGFVEGWTFRIRERAVEVSLNVSEYSLSVVSMRWKDINPAEAWNTINPATTWQKAQVVN